MSRFLAPVISRRRRNYGIRPGRMRRTNDVIRQFQCDQFIPGEPQRIWDFFASPQNLDLLTPPTLRFEIVGGVAPRMYVGQMIEYRIGIIPGFATRWLTEITHLRECEFFVDEQRLGPYKIWHHEHHFMRSAIGLGVQMIDRITYDPGWGFLGGVVNALWIRQQLTRIFDYRAAKVAKLFPDLGE